MAVRIKTTEYEKIVVGRFPIAAVYKGGVLIWEAVSKIWKDAQLWKNSEPWKY